MMINSLKAFGQLYTLTHTQKMNIDKKTVGFLCALKKESLTDIRISG